MFIGAGAIAAAEVGTNPTVIPSLSGQDAGARYGEAGGAVLFCYGLKITPRVAALR